MSQSKAKISKIESFSTVDGPGIRTTIFFSKCNLRCKYCHNPETWYQSENEYTIDDLYNKIMRNKPYFKNNGGVTFSGGEPLLHSEYLIDLCKKLKKEKIHIALDTAGIGKGNYKEILESLGGNVTGSVTKKTDYVLLGENPGSKYDKALKLNIPIWSEEEFEKKLKEENQ